MYREGLGFLESARLVLKVSRKSGMSKRTTSKARSSGEGDIAC